MTGVIARSNHPNSLWPGIAKHFGYNYNKYELQWPMVFNRRKSNKHMEVDVELTNMGYVPRKEEGSAVQYDTMREGYRAVYNHLTYAMGWIATEESIEDDLYETVAKRKNMALANSFRQTEEVLHALMFNEAYSANRVGGDGQPMISAAHPTLSGTQSNQLAVAADLSEAALEDLIIQIQGAQDSRGLRISLQPRKLVIPRQEQFNATRLTGSPYQPDTDLNNINAMQTLGMLPEGVFVWQYLEDPDAWFILTDAENAINHFDRVPLGELQQDDDFGTGNALAKNRTRYSMGWSDWRGVYGSPGA